MNEGLDPASVAVFFAAIFGITALACSRPEQWGFRRLAFGGFLCASAAAVLIPSPSPFLWGAILWGFQQVYLGWSFVSRRRRTTHERVEYLDASVSVLSYVALADGEIKPSERKIIHDTYARANFSADDLRQIEGIIRQCEQRFFADGSDPQRLYSLLRGACGVVLQHSNDRTRLAFLRAAVLIAASDGFITASERGALKAMAGWLGISDADERDAWRTVVDRDSASAPNTEERDSQSSRGSREDPIVPPDLATYYASILGVSVTASPQELKKAYRTRAKQYHPDVVMHQGAASARHAEERFKEISKAYDFFRGGSMAT